jgi:hypothetical protein
MFCVMTDAQSSGRQRLGKDWQRIGSGGVFRNIGDRNHHTQRLCRACHVQSLSQAQAKYVKRAHVLLYAQ